MYAAQWQILGGTGNIAGYQDWVSNYASWSMIQQTRSTLSTDLAFRWDKQTQALYINIAMDNILASPIHNRTLRIVPACSMAIIANIIVSATTS